MMTGATMTRFQGRYRVESTRLKNWDYAGPGAYFVTLCTQARACYLAECDIDQIRLTCAGQIVAEEWQRTAELRPTVTLDAWAILPNHVHGVLLLQQIESVDKAAAVPNGIHAGSLGAIIGQFKSVTTKRIRASGLPQFAWQPRFYERIVRGPTELDSIRRYIESNAAQWALDEHNPDRPSSKVARW
jgi:REP element-mobilizing transposase RayT